MQKRLLIIFIGILILSLSPIFATDWWDDDWKYRREIVVINNDSNPHISEYIEVELTNISASTGNYSKELVIIDDNGNKIEKQVLDISGNSVIINFIVNISANENKSYYIYYNNPNGTEIDENLRLMYETFEGQILNDPPIGWDYVDSCIDIISDAYSGERALGANGCGVGGWRATKIFSSFEYKGGITVCLAHKNPSNILYHDTYAPRLGNANIPYLVNIMFFYEGDIKYSSGLSYYDYKDTGYDHDWEYKYICSHPANMSAQNIWLEGENISEMVEVIPSIEEGFDRFEVALQRNAGSFDDIKIFVGNSRIKLPQILIYQH